MFHKYGGSGTLQKFDALCVLGMNIINEKVDFNLQNSKIFPVFFVKSKLLMKDMKMRWFLTIFV